MTSLLFYLLASISLPNEYRLHYPLKSSLPSVEDETSRIIHKKGFTASFNVRTKLPNWVAERLTIENLKRKAHREKCFFEPDPALSEEVQATEDDYRGSGLSHGHLAMAALHRGSEKEMQETFSFVNIVPQDHTMNCREWLAIEAMQLNLLKKAAEGSVLYVVSGPLWQNRSNLRNEPLPIKHIGPSQIPVPTDLFKVIKLVNKTGESASVGFIVQNIKHWCVKETHAFKVDVNTIEKLTGFNLSDMKSECDLLPSEEKEQMTMSWKLAWRLKIASTLEEVRGIVQVAIKRKYLTKDNPSLIRSVIQRTEDLSDDDVIEALTPTSCKRSIRYRDALKDALSSLDN